MTSPSPYSPVTSITNILKMTDDHVFVITGDEYEAALNELRKLPEGYEGIEIANIGIRGIHELRLMTQTLEQIIVTLSTTKTPETHQLVIAALKEHVRAAVAKVDHVMDIGHKVKDAFLTKDKLEQLEKHLIQSLNSTNALINAVFNENTA